MTTTEQIFGTWEESPTVAKSKNRLKLEASQLAQHWRRCSLTSDFLARYNALFVSEPPPPDTLPRNAVESVLSYLLNELFENTAKFSAGPLQTVSYQAWVLEDRMMFQITNHITPAGQAPFIALIHELLESDVDALYFQKLEENAELNRDGSGLGYLTLIKDYGIRFGFRFRPIQAESVAVDVQAHVTMKENE